MDKNYKARLGAGPAPLDQVRQSVYSDLQYVSLQHDDRVYGGWYRQLPDGRMELLALANMHCERRNERTPVEQARGMLEDFIRATRTQSQSDAASSAPPAQADESSEAEAQTLGKLLYAEIPGPCASEHEWVELVRLIAARDQLALDQLFQRTHRIVFTLIMRLIGNSELAEELTLDVYQDVWRQASQVDVTGGSVLAWLMNQARLRTLEHLGMKRGALARMSGGSNEPGAALPQALSALSANERQLIEAAYFSEQTYRDLAAQRQQPAADVKRQLQDVLEKLGEQLLRGSEP